MACEEEAVLGDGLIRLSLGSAAPEQPAVIYLPEGMQPLVLSLTAVKGEIAPAPGPPPVAGLRGLDHPGLDRLWAVTGLGGHRGQESRAEPRQPRVRGAGTGRHRLRRAHRRSHRGDHHRRLRRKLLDPHPAQRRHGQRRVPGLFGHRPPRAPRDAAGGGQPGAPARRRDRPQQARGDPVRHPLRHRVGDPGTDHCRGPRPVAGLRAGDHRRRPPGRRDPPRRRGPQAHRGHDGQGSQRRDRIGRQDPGRRRGGRPHAGGRQADPPSGSGRQGFRGRRRPATATDPTIASPGRRRAPMLSTPTRPPTASTPADPARLRPPPRTDATVRKSHGSHHTH